MSRLPRYVVPADGLEAGASLGNSALWLTCKATGAIERIFCVAAGESLIGSMGVRYGLALPDAAQDRYERRYVPALPIGSTTVELHPAYQRRMFSLTPHLAVSETIFLPLSAQDDAPVAYLVADLTNSETAPCVVRLEGWARLAASFAQCPEVHYDAGSGGLVAQHGPGNDRVAVFGCSARSACWAADGDLSAIYDLLHMPPLDGHVRSGDVVARLQTDVVLSPGGTQRVAYRVALAADGAQAALRAYRAGANEAQALAATVEYLDDVLARARVLTPDRTINEGALWSKVNMRRTMAHYPLVLDTPATDPRDRRRAEHGHWACTNDPGHSSAVVGRDAAWFVYGCDHFRPDFSRSLLDQLASVQDALGKIPEYYNALDGHSEDDGLNINDDTPLFVLACAHHYRTTGDLEWLRQVYPAIERAATYIVGQMDARGLVTCTATDPRGNVWASATWRNIIPGYSLNGAVTEINAECAAALRAAADLAHACAQQAASQSFRACSLRLRSAMDHHLLDKRTGLYALTLDLEGTLRRDITADQLFPVLFGVASEDSAAAITSRLGAPDFWTEAGVRTISRHDPLYDPSGYVGLLGGVWPGVTWWLAMACARYHPEMMVRALRSSFAHYATDPRTNNTVPGQFSEWFDGESLVNRGMRLSPWEPPRYLWAAVEGVCGLSPTVGPPHVHPLVPPAWKWVALRDVPYHGTALSYVVVRQGTRLHVYASTLVQTDAPAEVYAEDVTAAVTVADGHAVLGLRRPGELLVFLGNSGPYAAPTTVDLCALVASEGAYHVRVYDSERASWGRWATGRGRDLCAHTLMIELGGFRLIQIRDDGPSGSVVQDRSA